MLKRLVGLLMIAFMFSLFSACVDYGYTFQFSVIGENGIVVNRWWNEPSSAWRYESSPICIMGGKKASEDYKYQLELTAIPDDGYQVKEWICDDKIVEGNKTNTFIAVSTDYTNFKTIVTVEFELIP